MKDKRIYFFIGTTAEFIKLAPVIKQFKKRKIGFKIITSGQNKILFQEMEEYLGPVEIYLAFGEKDEISSVFYFALWALRTFFRGLVFLKKEFQGLNKNNSCVIVHGDTISSLIGALVARIHGLKIAHVEAGLRSFDFFEPFPEELCRFMISYLTDIHFCPNEWSVSNLRSRGGVKVNTEENTSIESFQAAVQVEKNSRVINKLGDYFVLLIHRQEHVVFGKKQTRTILEFILDHKPDDLNCVLMVNKVTSSFLRSAGLESVLQKRKDIILAQRLPYMNFIKLLAEAKCVLTDGGSTQEEAYYLGMPCLLLRNKTERIEGLDENVILAKNREDVIKDFLNNYQKYRKQGVYPDTLPSEIIADYLLAH